MSSQKENRAEAAPNEADVPLIVDLDGTLCRTDTLQEGLLRLAARQPISLFALPLWIAKGRLELKTQVADRIVIPAASLPLNDAVVDHVKQAREAGRPTALVSAADHRQVTAIAEEIGLFSTAQGSTRTRNLKGEEKARFLVEQYGEQGFDYVGDTIADLPVWKAARRAITVGASPSLIRSAENINAQSQHIAKDQPRSRAMLTAIRPHQWSKNLLIFLPALAAHDFNALLPVLFGFAAFCMTASAVYIVNDLLDLDADRAHPRKRNRPFAAGDLTGLEGLLFASGLLLTAFLLSVLSGVPEFMLILLTYFMATLTYSFWLKRKLIVDIITLAGLYTIRILAGGIVGAVLLSPWMLAFSMFLFLALAATKRQAELTDILASGRSPEGRAYVPEDLPIIRSVATTAGQAAILVLAIYIASDTVQELYALPELLWLICPLLLYWILRMVMKAHRGQMTDDPIVFAATDLVSLVTILAAGAIVLAAAFPIWPELSG